MVLTIARSVVSLSLILDQEGSNQFLICSITNDQDFVDMMGRSDHVDDCLQLT